MPHGLPVATRATTRAIAVLLVAGGGAACNPIYYSPNTQNVALFQARGEFAGAAMADGNRIEAHVAYAVSDRLALQFNAGLFDPEDLDNGDGGSGHFFEGGAGTFGALGGGLTWEGSALLGFGRFENHFPSTREDHPETTGDISGSLFRFGIQPGIGYRSRHFEAAVSSRIVGLRYTGITGSLIFADEDQVEYLRRNDSFLLFEPALTVRAGLETVKLQLQLGGSLNLTDRDFRQDDSLLTLGLFVRLPGGG